MNDTPDNDDIVDDSPAAKNTAAPEPQGDAPIYMIEFKGSRKECYRDPYQLPLSAGDHVIVQVERGEDLGRVVQRLEGEHAARAKVKPLPILRVAVENELTRAAENREKEHEARKVCISMVAERGLKMKVVDAEWQFDGNKITFYFTAEKRVDFRQLVKDLASTYRTRIELRQIGARDEARRVGGLGVCGLEQCCTSFLKEFEPVTTQLAREQSLSLNPAKISGNCGRLLCCLRYESGYYRETTRHFPRVGTEWRTPDGVGTVDAIQILKERMLVKMPDGERHEVSLADIKRGKDKKKSWFE